MLWKQKEQIFAFLPLTTKQNYNFTLKTYYFESTEPSVILQNVIIFIIILLFTLFWLSPSQTAEHVDVPDLFLSPWFSLWLAVCIHKSTAGFGSKVSVVNLDKRMCIRDERGEWYKHDVYLFFYNIQMWKSSFTCSTAQWQCKRQDENLLNVGITIRIACLHYIQQVMHRRGCQTFSSLLQTHPLS